MPTNPLHREAVPETPNRLGIEGIEFIEYTTSHPQALGQVLENMGFKPVARHRSREVTLYRQGGMNLVVNANPEDARMRDRKSTRLNSSHIPLSRMPSSA